MTVVYKNRLVSVAELVPSVRNARTHSEAQVAQIAASIQEFGFSNPIIIDEVDGVLAGHGRLLAAELIKLDKVPARQVFGLSETQKRALMLADNKLALNAGWDLDLLRLELGEIQADGYDISLVGFSDDELAGLKLGGEDLMDVGGVGDSAVSKTILKWGDKEVPMSDQEVEGLNALFGKHYAENGVAFGFVRRLLGDHV
jgi:hypothetical protein